MTTIDTSKWSQADYSTGIARLNHECGELEKQLTTMVEPSKIPARPGASGDVISSFATMATHVTKLRQIVGLNAETVAASSAAATAKTGIQQPGAKAAASESITPVFSPDAQVLAHYGVKSIEELNALQLPVDDFDASAKVTLDLATGIGTTAPSAWNPDAAILKARGVASLEELNDKYSEGIRVKQ